MSSTASAPKFSESLCILNHFQHIKFGSKAGLFASGTAKIYVAWGAEWAERHTDHKSDLAGC